MIAIDTQILIWAIKRKPTDRQDMIARTDALFTSVAASGERIMIPATVIAEFLVQYTEPQRIQVLSALERGFFIAPFDATAARIAARLFQDRREWEAARKAANSTRQWIKADLAIIATAVAHGASTFYVEDLPLRTTAQALRGQFTMDIMELPPLPPQKLTPATPLDDSLP